MGLHANVRGVSKITLTLLVVISAIIGGIISYAFTIAYYAKIPEKTSIAITSVYINPKNVRSFNVTVLNPSYSPSDANITRIALSLKNETKLYEVIETMPPIKNGLKIRIGESVNVTCIKIRKDDMDMTFGEFVSAFPGETILVHVFAVGSSAANVEIPLPYVKLEITADFNPRVSFKKFNITLTNSPKSQVNLTITSLDPGLIKFEEVYPDFRSTPFMLQRNETVCFQFINGNWHGYTQILLEVRTEQGYVFRKEVRLETAHSVIQAVNFDENRTDRFDVTIYNFVESAVSVNVKNIKCRLENGSLLIFDCGSAEVMPNTTKIFTLNWDWREYRGKNVTVAAYFTQDFETPEYKVQTPPPIILKVLDAGSAFNLKDKERFNITILNHASSLETVNITRIVVKKTRQALPVADGIIPPGLNKTFTCNFTWSSFLNSHGRNLELTVYAVANQTLKGYAFNFSFTLPVAEFKITAVGLVKMGETTYLNLTVKNLDYSLWNLTLSKVILTVQGLSEPLECVLPKGHVVVRVGVETVLLCPFDWQRYVGKSLTITVVTEELIEASATYMIPEALHKLFILFTKACLKEVHIILDQCESYRKSACY